MTIVNKVEQRAQLAIMDIVKLQLLMYCFFKGISMTEHELECLTLLAIQGESDLNSFCKLIGERQLYASAQTARNVMNKFEKKALVVKHGKKKKQVHINPEVKLQTTGNILLDCKFAHIS